MYETENGIVLKIVKTWVYEGDEELGALDTRIGKKCYELESEGKKYSLRCFEEDLECLNMLAA